MRHLLFAVLCIARIAFAQSEPVPMDRVEEGVYTLYHYEMLPEERRRRAMWFQTTILELKDGRFRYWMRSDAKQMPGEEVRYPLTGTYTAKGGTVTMEIKIASRPAIEGEQPRDFYMTEKWTFMRYGDQVLLWPSKLPARLTSGRIPHNVLLRSRLKPEEIWKQAE